MSGVCLSASTPNAAKVSFGLKYTAADEVNRVSLSADTAGNSAMGSVRKGRRASPNCRRSDHEDSAVPKRSDGRAEVNCDIGVHIPLFSRTPLPIRLSRNRRYRRYIRNHHTRLIDFIEDDAREIRASGNTLPILVEMQRFFVRAAVWTSGEGADQNAEVTMMQSDPGHLTDVHRVVREVAESLRGNSERAVKPA
jgi:hypothetical protein